MNHFDTRTLGKILYALRRSLGLRKDSSQPVSFTTDPKCTTIRITTAEASVACQIPQPGPHSYVSAPLSTFADMPTSRHHEVQIVRRGNISEVQFTSRLGLHSAATPASLSTVGGCDVASPANIREVASASSVNDVASLAPICGVASPVVNASQAMYCNPGRLGQALQQAASIADPTSTRYSLGSLRLRGADGQIAATDGRQAFLADGFNFPPGEILIPASVLAKHPLLSKGIGYSIGVSARTGCVDVISPEAESLTAGKPTEANSPAQTDNRWLSLRFAVGIHRWMLEIKALEQGRFPNVDQCMPRPDDSRSVMRIAESDANFLAKSLSRMLGRSPEPHTLTIDLSVDHRLGRPVVRLRFCCGLAPAGDLTSGQFVELTLADSRFESQPMRVVTHAGNFLTALKMGHREIFLQGPSRPAFCRSADTQYVWTTMHDSLAIGPSFQLHAISTARTLAAG